MSLKRKILWIDDEPNILKSYQRALRNENCELMFSLNGEAALEILKKNELQVVISDYRMPGLNGLEVLKLVKELDSRIVRVILSGYADENAVRQSLSSGNIDKYLLKPIGNDEIRNEVSSLFKLYDERNKEVRTSDR